MQIGDRERVGFSMHSERHSGVMKKKAAGGFHEVSAGKAKITTQSIVLEQLKLVLLCFPCFSVFLSKCGVQTRALADILTGYKVSLSGMSHCSKLSW